MNNNADFFKWSEIEPLCIIKLLLRKLWLVVLAFLIGYMSVSIVLGNLVSRSYSCSATFAVTSNSNGSYYSNTSAASEVVNIYSQLLQGRFMDDLILKDLGSSVSGSINATQLGDTNLISLTVSSDSPRDALLIMQSIMRNYQELSEYVSSSVVLNQLNTPNVSISVNQVYNVKDLGKKAGLILAAAMVCAIIYLEISRGAIQNMTAAKSRLDGRIIGSIPHETAKGSGKSPFRRHKRSDLQISSSAISFAFTESVHSIASRLEHEQSKGKQVFLFTSVTEGEGKSTIAANTALTLASNSGSVLFIDMDLRRPVQSDIFNVKPGKNSSFGDLLVSDADPGEILDSAVVDPSSGMEMLLSSRSYTDTIDLLASPLLEEVIALARTRFDFIVIDSPPLGYFADSEVLSDLADGTLLVIRQNIVPAPEINDAIDSLKACKADFLGCILNDMQHLSRHLKYGYGYNYGYGYGSKYGYGYGKSSKK